jgi:hypothetical protein
MLASAFSGRRVLRSYMRKEFFIYRGVQGFGRKERNGHPSDVADVYTSQASRVEELSRGFNGQCVLHCKDLFHMANPMKSCEFFWGVVMELLRPASGLLGRLFSTIQSSTSPPARCVSSSHLLSLCSPRYLSILASNPKSSTPWWI